MQQWKTLKTRGETQSQFRVTSPKRQMYLRFSNRRKITLAESMSQSIPLATTEDEFDQMMAINAKSAYFFIKEAGLHLNDHGKLITIVTALLAAFTDGYSTYAGGKAPVEHFTRAAAKEFSGRGISVNNIAPGPMDTPFFYGQETPESVEYHKSQALGNDLTKIEDIVPIVRFLATDGWWITGQTIFANGGYTTR